MAKLNVVIPSVDVEVAGVKCRKVERDAKAGDIVKALEDKTDIDAGSFYEVISDEDGDIYFVDDGGDKRYTQLSAYSHRYEVYEKVTEAPVAPTNYREVKRKANVGERIRIVDKDDSRYENDDEFIVTNRDEDGDVYVSIPPSRSVMVCLNEYVVLEPVEAVVTKAEPTQPERLKVGEYAKVIQERHCNAGKIVKITQDNAYDEYIYRTELLDGESADVHTPSQLVRATDAEVAAAKQALERTKAIGEFVEGGYAVVVDASKSECMNCAPNGTYVSAKTTQPYPYHLILTKLHDNYAGFCNADALRKITKEEYEAATKPAPKFEVVEKVRLISGGGNMPLNGFTNGEIYTLVATESDGWGCRVKILVGAQGQPGYAKPNQLEKVSAEEIAKLAEEAQWAKIGRKVGEYKAGDVVEVMKYTGYVPLGSIGVVSNVTIGEDFRVNTPEHTSGNFHDAEDVKLIAPVESLFNVTTAGGKRK